VIICDFCFKSQYAVKLLIAGPNVMICNACVDICNEVVAEHAKEGTKTND